MCLLPFDQVIPNEKVDLFFEKKLEDELPGILNWALDGCIAWQYDGMKRPRRVRRATKGYLTEMDVMKQFIEERIVERPGEKERAAVLYSAYRDWALEQGERPVTNTRFGTALVERGFEKDKDNKGVVYYDIKVLRHGG